MLLEELLAGQMADCLLVTGLAVATSLCRQPYPQPLWFWRCCHVHPSALLIELMPPSSLSFRGKVLPHVGPGSGATMAAEGLGRVCSIWAG